MQNFSSISQKTWKRGNLVSGEILMTKPFGARPRTNQGQVQDQDQGKDEEQDQD